MKVKAHAKVNLALDILRTREDGLHEMDMINAPVNLYDELDIEPIGDSSSADGAADEIICDTFRLPDNSTLHKTMKLLRERFSLANRYRIRLVKNIPDQAGLGGGSADAAALLKAINTLENLGLDEKQLEEIGFQIGADVPFCLHSDFCRVKGAGEKVTELHSTWKIPVLLAQGVKGISTRDAFDRYEKDSPAELDIDIVQDAVRKKDLGLLYQTMTNAFEPQAMEHLDELAELREDMRDAGLVRVMMTGSGSCLMGFCVDDDIMDEAYEILSGKYPFVWKGEIGL